MRSLRKPAEHPRHRTSHPQVSTTCGMTRLAGWSGPGPHRQRAIPWLLPRTGDACHQGCRSELRPLRLPLRPGTLIATSGVALANRHEGLHLVEGCFGDERPYRRAAGVVVPTPVRGDPANDVDAAA